MTTNTLRLSAVLQGKDALRYSPAGIALLDLSLVHESSQREAGIDRQVEIGVQAIAAGDLAVRLNQLVLGSQLLLSGFLAAKRKLSKTLVFHITSFELNS